MTEDVKVPQRHADSDDPFQWAINAASNAQAWGFSVEEAIALAAADYAAWKSGTRPAGEGVEEEGQTVSNAVYESAVKGRRDFRAAYREQRGVTSQLLEALEELAQPVVCPPRDLDEAFAQREAIRDTAKSAIAKASGQATPSPPPGDGIAGEAIRKMRELSVHAEWTDDVGDSRRSYTISDSTVNIVLSALRSTRGDGAMAVEVVEAALRETEHEMDNYMPAAGESSQECFRRRLKDNLAYRMDTFLRGQG